MVVFTLQTYPVGPAWKCSSNGNPSALLHGPQGVRCLLCFPLTLKDPLFTCHELAKVPGMPIPMHQQAPHWVLATGGADGVVRMWRVCMSAPLQPREACSPCPAQHTVHPFLAVKACTLEEGAVPAVRAFAVSPDRQSIVIGTSLGSVFLHPLQLHPCKRSPSPPRWIAGGHASPVAAVAVHPCCHAVFATSCRSSQVLFWHSGACAALGSAAATSAAPCSLAFRQPDGLHLAAGLCTGTVEIFDRNRRRVVSLQHSSTGKVNAVAYCPQGRVLATAGDDLTVSLFSERDGCYRRYATCRGHLAAVLSIDFTTDGRVLRSSCKACQV
jgi:WD40 repeat protein